MSAPSHPIVVPRPAPRYVPRPIVVPTNLMHKSTGIETPAAERDMKAESDAAIWFLATVIVILVVMLIVNWFLPKEEDLADKLRKGMFK